MRLLKRPEVTVSLSFMIIGILWIILSDRLLLIVQTNSPSVQITQIQTIKGCIFILVLTLLIYLMIKSSSKELLRSREEYKDLFYNTPDPMLVFDLKTSKICNANRAALEKYGYSIDEFKAMTITDVRFNEYPQNNTTNRKCNTYEHKKKTNEVIICEETSRRIMFKNEPAYLLSAHEITELETTKAELTQREMQLQQILNSITDGFFILSHDLKITRANKLFKEKIEVPVEKVEGAKLSDLFPRLETNALFTQYAEAIKKKKEIHFETFDSKNLVWYRIWAYPFDAGMTVFFRDITKEKGERLQSYQNEQNLIALINNTEDFIWSIDDEFKYFTFNEPYKLAYKAIFKEDLWVGKIALNEGQGGEHIAKWKQLYTRALNGEKFAVEMDFALEDKCLFTTVRFNPIYNAEKKVIGVGCFLQNISERKQYESKIEQQNDKLKQIAFITSHKVRAPLANILGLVDVLDKENPLNESNFLILEHIKTSAKQLDRTIINMVQETAQLKN